MENTPLSQLSDYVMIIALTIIRLRRSHIMEKAYLAFSTYGEADLRVSLLEVNYVFSLMEGKSREACVYGVHNKQKKQNSTLSTPILDQALLFCTAEIKVLLGTSVLSCCCF